MTEADRPEVEALGAAAGWPYPTDEKQIVASLVVCGDQGEILMGCKARSVPEIYLYNGMDGQPPAAKLHAIRLLHDHMASILRDLGYNEANVFLPPRLERSFGRRLMRSFSWVRNWESFAKRF